MNRKIYKELLTWKEKDSSKTALLIDGVRRVGILPSQALVLSLTEITRP